MIIMNRDEYTMSGLNRHLKEFQKVFPNYELLFIGVQGSQNYVLDLYTDEYQSDVDTKAIILPTLEDIVMSILILKIFVYILIILENKILIFLKYYLQNITMLIRIMMIFGVHY